MLVIAIAGFIIGSNEAIRSQLLGQIQSLIGQQTAEAIDQMIEQNTRSGGGIVASIIGVVTLLIDATGLFGQLQGALNTIWDVEEKSSGRILGIVKDRFLSLTMVLGLSFLLLVSLVISTGLTVINNYFNSLFGGFGGLAEVINFAVSTLVIGLMFSLIFKVLPDRSSFCCYGSTTRPKYYFLALSLPRSMPGAIDHWETVRRMRSGPTTFRPSLLPPGLMK